MTTRGSRLFVALFLASGTASAQELEPRALINVPVGTNFLVLASGYIYGNVLLDPAVPIEDGTADVWSLAGGYVRAIDVFGMAGRVGLVLPFASGTWQATFAGADTSTSRTGFGDPILKLSLNFLGSPALTRSGFGTYRQKTVAGFMLNIAAPLGQYYPERLVNLGTNRWTISPRLGASTVLGNWVLEGYVGASFFTRNQDFFGGREVTQEPLVDVQAHVIRLLGRRGWWAAGSSGYAWGGRSTVGGVQKDPLENVRLSLMLRVPVGRQHGFKLVYINGLSTRLGTDFDTIQLAWQSGFGGKP